MSCRDWARKTVLLLESDLAPEETAEVRRHVASCESCAGLLRELEQARDAVHLLRALEPSTADLDVVRRRVMESLEARKTSFAWLAWKPALAAGAVVAVVLGTWFLVRWNPSQRRDLAGLPAEP